MKHDDEDKKGPVVAIDGPAGTGKSTLAKLLAERLRCRYIDTGAMYRAVALLALEEDVDPDDPGGLGDLMDRFSIDYVDDSRGTRILLCNRDVTDAIRQPGVGEAASKLSRFPVVREALVESQRGLARLGSVVMEGRDIGSVVLPHADLKVFLDAREEEKAKRRHLQWKGKGIEVPVDKILEDMQVRDQRDRKREAAPLTLAEDAVRIDTSEMDVQEVLDRIVVLAAERGLVTHG